MSAYAVIGGVLREVAPSAPVIGGVRQAATAGQVVVGGVLREIWPGLPEPGRALEDYTWEEIAQVAAAGKASQYWEVGVWKHVLLGGGRYDLQIIGFDHDDLAISDARYGTGYNKGLGKAAITFQLMQIHSWAQPMHDSNNFAFWKATTMRNSTLKTMKTYLPDALQGAIRTVAKATHGTSVNDELFLLSEFEVTGEARFEIPAEGNRYEYYPSGSVSFTRVRSKDQEHWSWWLRTAGYFDSTYEAFVLVTENGTVSTTHPTNIYGVSFAFCI